jgi:hypothetical protein
MIQISFDLVAIFYRTEGNHITAATLALGHVDLEDLGEHLAPTVVFETALFIVAFELEAFFDVGFERDFLTVL